MKTVHVIPDAALAQHTAIVGKTGSGKTSTAKLAVEQVVADGSRVCVLDPIKSDWWGVISSADGKRPGLPFHILGGPRAHVPLHSGAGAAIGELVARGDLPLSVLDMADFEAGGQQRFFVAFADTLLKRMRGVLYLVLEEAHEFAPKERAGWEKENLAIHYAKKLATAGRSKGIRLIIATQRTQSLHNALLGSCDTLIAHRLTAPADQGPVKKWLEAQVDKDLAKKVSDELSALKTGTGWLCSGEARVFERVQFPRISTFDNSATPTEDAREIAVRGAEVDQDALRALIGDAVAEAEANDPKKLKQQIAQLEKDLKKAQSQSGPTPEQIRAIRDEGYAEGAAAAVAELRSRVRPHVEALRGPVDELTHALANGSVPPAPAAARVVAPRQAPAPRVGPPRPQPARAPRPAPRGGRQAVESNLGSGEIKVLTAVAQHERGVTREQLTVLTGYKRSSRDTYLQRLGARGLVTPGPGGTIVATDAGVDELGDDFEPLPTGEQLRRYWLDKLPQGERVILEVLIDAYPEAVDRDAITAATDYKRSSRDTYLQRLSARQLVANEGRGSVRASEDLF